MLNLKTLLPTSRKAQIGLAVGAAFVLLVAIGLFSIDAENPSDVVLFVGRFHPLLVHLPIGFLLAAFLLEGIGWLSPRLEGVGQAVPFLLGLGALGAVVAAIAGSLLALDGGYDEGLVFWHQRLGIAVTVLAALAFLFRVLARGRHQLVFRRLYGVLLVSTVGLLGAAGHLGGSLTHGEDYLTRYLPDPLRQLAGMPPQGAAPVQEVRFEEVEVFAHLIDPIFQNRCIECHNPNKMKGDLRLDTPEMILAGGETGDVLIPGDAEGSELFRRVILPAHDDDRMPPEGDPLTLEEIELLRWWISSGSSFDQKLADLKVTSPAIQLVLDWRFGAQENRPTGVFALDVPPADSQAVERLRELGASVAPIAQDLPFLQVHASADFGDEEMEALRPLAEQVIWLDLSGTQVTDTGSAVLADLRHLTRLHLERTAVTDAALAYLEGLEHLEYLNLYGTAVSDDGLDYLAALDELETVYLWQTDVTWEGAERLRAARPGLTVDLGLDPAALPVEVTAASQE